MFVQLKIRCSAPNVNIQIFTVDTRGEKFSSDIAKSKDWLNDLEPSLDYRVVNLYFHEKVEVKMNAMIGMLKEALRPMTDPFERGCGIHSRSSRECRIHHWLRRPSLPCPTEGLFCFLKWNTQSVCFKCAWCSILCNRR